MAATEKALLLVMDSQMSVQFITEPIQKIFSAREAHTFALHYVQEIQIIAWESQYISYLGITELRTSKKY